MRLGIIDLGTNSVRFDVHQIGPRASQGKPSKLAKQEGGLRTLHREKLMVRLGQGVFMEGKLDRDAIRRTVQAFASFKRTSDVLHVQKIVAFGTSALREASDADRLLTLIRTRTGIDVRVISGAEEARLIAQGILAYEKRPKGHFALLDIGGGSAEVSLCHGREILHSESFLLGTARLQQVFLKSSPPKPMAIEALRRHIRSTVLSKAISEDWPQAALLIGSSGTIRALAKMRKAQKAQRKVGKSAAKSATRQIDLKDLRKWVGAMTTMTTTQLLGLPGMEAKRVDMILAGAILLEETMAALGAKKCVTTEYSLRDGILQEELQLHREHRGTHIALHLPDLYAKAERLGASRAHLNHVVKTCELLFDRLKPLHQLAPDWKSYLTAAAILHDVGEAVTPTRHEEHSYYLVKNADFPSMEKWETEFVAQLCRWHASGKPNEKDLEFGGAEGKAGKETARRRQAFFKLLALLRVADSLDRGHRNVVNIARITLTQSKGRRKEAAVRLHLKLQSGRHANAGMDLELLRIEQKKALFEQVYGRKLIAGV